MLIVKAVGFFIFQCNPAVQSALSTIIVYVPTQLLNSLKWVQLKGNMSKYFLPAGTQINSLDLSSSFYYTLATLQTWPMTQKRKFPLTCFNNSNDTHIHTDTKIHQQTSNCCFTANILSKQDYPTSD